MNTNAARGKRIGLRYEGNTGHCVTDKRGRILLMMLLPLVLCLLATSAGAQEGSSVEDAKALLLAVRRKVMLTIQRLPRLLCTETIYRATFQPEANLAGVYKIEVGLCASLLCSSATGRPYPSER